VIGIFSSRHRTQTALAFTHRPIQWVPGALCQGVKRPGLETDPLSPSTAKVKNAWSYPLSPQCIIMAWYLVKRRSNFTFIFGLPYKRVRRRRILLSTPAHFIPNF